MRVSVVGSGPNGLAAAVIMARAGHEVTVHESAAKAGGGLRTDRFEAFDGIFDVCSAAHPMALASVFFQSFEITRRVDFLTPDISYAHAMEGVSAVAYRSLQRTIDELGRSGAGWGRVMKPLLLNIEAVRRLGGMDLRARPSTIGAAAALAAAVGGLSTLREDARSLAAGVTAHAAAPFGSFPARFVGAVLAAEAHASGWPIPRGGSAAIAEALVSDLVAHGGEINVGHHVDDLREVWRPGDVAILNIGPRGFARLGRGLLPASYSRRLSRYRYGNAASKVDFVLSAPIPWADSRLRDAGTVHIGGHEADISRAEKAARAGVVPVDPYVLLSQPTRLDRSRLPEGSSDEIVWAYAHVPNNSEIDASEMIARRIESFAPGFRELIIHHEARPAPFFAATNANFVGGDILGGRVDAGQLLTRPTLTTRPWRTPLPGVYLASASTPPGAGVHGMAGWHAARLALRDLDQTLPDLGVR
ncbi:NAD(P)/FAD-dependent oxidoreductase [Microbacterium sp. KSW4-17]|uniref:NAD(P)/FAD-dependent oxidoreductase n=1 Tax=Microbacterium galbum TaxID=3075994 RepID=A0ABU3T4U6_9MICO|nr:NAD(P)/FAD-dependent oxidoreductase [Microbacterium sp. KSW4-17]MDU0366397.1 NAD(P)/FAD-dependent oxidoreductase [Microbacterium sp. KSW4-17]